MGDLKLVKDFTVGDGFFGRYEKLVKDVVLPSINDWQGPLMHMPVTDNPEAWTNQKVKEFFGKQSVVAVPREEWQENLIKN